MKKQNDPRHLSRVMALQELFGSCFMSGDYKESGFQLSDLANINEFDNYDEKLFNQITEGVRDTVESLNDQIKKYAPQWPIEQIKKVDLQVLRIAIYEGFKGEITPPKVAIDEAIELAKEFGGNTSSKFVNGVLGAIYEKNKVSNKATNAK